MLDCKASRILVVPFEFGREIIISCVLHDFVSVSDFSVWNKSLSQRWRRLRRRCSSFTTSSSSHSPGNSQQQQLLSPDTPRARVVPRPPRGTSPEPWSSPEPSRNSMLPDMQHMLRSKLHRIHDGLRKSRTFSVHEVQTNKQPTFYVPSPLSNNCRKSESDSELDDLNLQEARLSSLPPFPVKDRSSPSTKPPSTCSSGRGSGTPTEELDRRSNHSNRSSVSSSASGSNSRRYENSVYPEWDHGYHSIEGTIGLDHDYDLKSRKSRVSFAVEGNNIRPGDYRSDSLALEQEFSREDEFLDTRNRPKTRSCRRWSQADTISLQRFVIGGAVSRREVSPVRRDSGPSSLNLSHHVECGPPSLTVSPPPPPERPHRLSKLPTRSSGDLQRPPQPKHKVNVSLFLQNKIHVESVPLTRQAIYVAVVICGMVDHIY